MEEAEVEAIKNTTLLILKKDKFEESKKEKEKMEL
jgi:hypothetical protein